MNTLGRAALPALAALTLAGCSKPIEQTPEQNSDTVRVQRQSNEACLRAIRDPKTHGHEYPDTDALMNQGYIHASNYALPRELDAFAAQLVDLGSASIPYSTIPCPLDHPSAFDKSLVSVWIIPQYTPKDTVPAGWEPKFGSYRD